MSITQYSSVLCAVAVVTLVRYYVNICLHIRSRTILQGISDASKFRTTIYRVKNNPGLLFTLGILIFRQPIDEVALIIYYFLEVLYV